MLNLFSLLPQGESIYTHSVIHTLTVHQRSQTQQTLHHTNTYNPYNDIMNMRVQRAAQTELAEQLTMQN